MVGYTGVCYDQIWSRSKSPLRFISKVIKWIHWINFDSNDLFWLYVKQDQTSNNIYKSEVFCRIYNFNLNVINLRDLVCHDARLQPGLLETKGPADYPATFRQKSSGELSTRRQRSGIGSTKCIQTPDITEEKLHTAVHGKIQLSSDKVLTAAANYISRTEEQ